MSTTVKIIIAVAIIGVGTGAWFFLQGGSSNSESPLKSVDSKKPGFTVSEDNAGFGSIKSIMGKGKDVECAIGLSAEAEEAEFGPEGVVYIDGGSGQFRMNIDNPDGSQIGIISTTQTMYQWFGNEGTKISQANAEEMAEFNASDPYLNEAGDEYDETYDEELEYRYECKSWKVDNKLFIPPSNVAFTDMDEMMDLMRMGMPSGI